jgi:hypothetical protein
MEKFSMTHKIKDIDNAVPIFSQSYTIAQNPSNGTQQKFYPIGSGTSSSMDARLDDIDLRFSNNLSSS